MRSSTRNPKLSNINTQHEKNHPAPTQVEDKKPQFNTLNVHLSNGDTLPLTKQKRRVANTVLTYYSDVNTKKDYIIKNTDNLAREYLGAIAFSALGIDVPDFFLGSIRNADGVDEVVLMQQLFDKSRKLDPDSSTTPLSDIMPAMTNLVTAAALLGDHAGFCFNSKHVRMVNGKIYKIDNSEIFNHLVADPKIMMAKLFHSDLCSHKDIVTTVKILADHDFECYKSVIESFFASFNSQHFTQQIIEGYNHPWLQGIKKDFTYAELLNICSRIANTAEHFPAIMNAELSAGQASQATELDLPHEEHAAEFYQQATSPTASASDQYPEFYQQSMVYQNSGAYQQQDRMFSPVFHAHSPMYPLQEPLSPHATQQCVSVHYPHSNQEAYFLTESLPPSIPYEQAAPFDGYYYLPQNPHNVYSFAEYVPTPQQNNIEFKDSTQTTLQLREQEKLLHDVQKTLLKMNDVQQEYAQNIKDLQSSMSYVLQTLKESLPKPPIILTKNNEQKLKDTNRNQSNGHHNPDSKQQQSQAMLTAQEENPGKKKFNASAAHSSKFYHRPTHTQPKPAETNSHTEMNSPTGNGHRHT